MTPAPAHVRASVHRSRRAVVVLTLLALAATLLSLPSPVAEAARPGTATATKPTTFALSFTGLEQTPAGAPGSPALLVEQGRPFTVTATMVDANGVAAAYSPQQDTVLSITATGGASGFTGGATTAVVPGGARSASFADLTLAAANRVTLVVTATAPAKAGRDLTPGSSVPFDVVLDTQLVGVPVADRGSSLLVSAGNPLGTPCEPTPEEQTCVDVVLPNGVASDVFFSTGVCTGGIGCSAEDRTVLQVLADLGTERYSPTAPATLIVKCDKTLCGGGGIPSLTLQASLTADGDLATAPACSSKGVVDAGLEHCVDYVQSKRDGSGDSYLYWLITKDARMSIG